MLSAFLPTSPWYEEYLRLRQIWELKPRSFIRRLTFLWFTTKPRFPQFKELFDDIRNFPYVHHKWLVFPL